MWEGTEAGQAGFNGWTTSPFKSFADQMYHDLGKAARENHPFYRDPPKPPVTHNLPPAFSAPPSPPITYDYVREYEPSPVYGRLYSPPSTWNEPSFASSSRWSSDALDDVPSASHFRIRRRGLILTAAALAVAGFAAFKIIDRISPSGGTHNQTAPVAAAVDQPLRRITNATPYWVTLPIEGNNDYGFAGRERIRVIGRLGNNVDEVRFVDRPPSAEHYYMRHSDLDGTSPLSSSGATPTQVRRIGPAPVFR
jgi:hypothetical protein